MRPSSWSRRAPLLAPIVMVLVMTGSDITGRLGLTTAAAATIAEAPARQLPNLDEIMREKLEHGQRLLEAIVLGEHVAVERYAYELTLLSEASTWTSLRTPEYLMYAASFREISGRLMKEAQEQNTEGMSFAYTELITTCVQCHLHVRGADTAD